MKKISLTYLALLMCIGCIGNPINDIQQLSMTDGLSNNYVVSIAQDKKGFLWFATEEGLNKFDGSRFIPFYKNNENVQSINGNELNCLLDDPQDSILWIGTQRAGINAYNYANNTFKSYQHKEEDPTSLTTNDITNIIASSDGNLWICTFWKGIDYFDKKKEEFLHYNTQTIPGLGSNHIWALEEGKDNKIYIGHVNEGFSILSTKDKRAKNYRHIPEDPNSIPGNEVTCIYMDRNEHIWVGTNNGLALYIPQSDHFISLGKIYKELSHRVFDIKQINSNKLWIALEFGGIVILDLSQTLIQTFNNLELSVINGDGIPYGLSSSSIRCLQQDSFGNIWVGSWGGGINFIPQGDQLFKHYSYIPNSFKENTLTNKTALSLCADSNDNIWIGTDGGGINVFSNGKRTAIYNTDNSKISSNIIQAAFCDSKGGLWFGTFNKGISYYNTESKQFHSIQPQELKDEDIRSFYEDNNGNIWVATSNGIVIIDPKSNHLKRYSNLENNLTRSIIQDSKKQTWVGFFGAGLGIYDENMRLIHLFNVDNQFPSNTINAIFQDSKQRIWVATGEGLVCFPTPKENILSYHIYQHDKGLVNLHIHAITEDTEGNIWFSTNKGISCLTNDLKTCLCFDFRDNLPSGSFNSRSLASGKDGSLYFGSIDGVCHFIPSKALEEQESPIAVINSIEINSMDSSLKDNIQSIMIDGTSNITLNYTQNDFRIRFNILNYQLINHVEYAYKLKGLNDSWYLSTNLNSTTFRNLDPGNYTFYVKTRIRNKKWSEASTILNIKILPPIWLTWWAKSGYVIISLLIVAYILYLYYKHFKAQSLYKLEKQNHEKEQELNNERLRFYTNITHELRTPLTLILGPLEDLKRENSLSPIDSQKISIIHQSCLRLLGLINQLLEFRKTETQNRILTICKRNLSNLVTEIGLRYKELNRNQKIDLIIDVQPSIHIYYDSEVLTIILNNLLSNAMKYTLEGEIRLELEAIIENNTHYIELRVKDTGYGIEPEVLPYIFDRYYQAKGKHQASGTGIGLALVKSLANLHEGSIEVESTLGKGTTFKFRLLSQNTYSKALHVENNSIEPLLIINENDIKENNEQKQKTVILVIEDNDDIREYIAVSLRTNYHVISATNGKEGLELALRHIPDVIISDIMMPIMDGIELCTEIKKDIRSCHIPIILLTAKDSLDDQKEGYKHGADSYLTKPFSANMLHSRIENLLGNRRKLIQYFNMGNQKKNSNFTQPTQSEELDNEFILKINQLIEDRLEYEKIDIGYLSDKMCMSSSTLYRKMKALTGMSTNEYIRKVRMHHAKKFLNEGKYNISEITYKVGMNSLFYFRQCFKEEFGCTPTEYLRKISPSKQKLNYTNDNHL